MDGLLLMDIKLWYACRSISLFEKEDTEDRCLMPATDRTCSPLHNVWTGVAVCVMGRGDIAAGVRNRVRTVPLRLHGTVLGQAEEKFRLYLLHGRHRNVK
jgi:hypothetical protein